MLVLDPKSLALEQRTVPRQVWQIATSAGGAGSVIRRTFAMRKAF